MKSARSHRRASPTASILFLCLALMVPLVAGACGSDLATGDNDGPDATPAQEVPGGYRLAMSDVPRLQPSAPEADVQAVADSIELFGADLYRILAAETGDGNLVFSPTSIATALAMTYAGAAGSTAEGMAATLNFSLEGDALHQAFNSLGATLTSRNRQEIDRNGVEQGVTLNAADSLWCDEHWEFERDFLDILAADYGAGVRLVDLSPPAEEARRAINGWVAGETNDKIPGLIHEGGLDDLEDEAVLMLVDALYFGATWAEPFIPFMTSDHEFTLLNGETVMVPMMHQQERAFYPYSAGDGWQAVELPYFGGEVAMLLVVPDPGRFSEIETGLPAGLIGDVVSNLQDRTEVQLGMPKFEFRWKDGLKEALTTLGMGPAFDREGAADFSRMRRAADIWIGDVVHEAYIAVDEDGTEAAAATGVTMVASAETGVPTYIALTIDRPFIFAVRDRQTGAILFMGRVTDPTK